MNTWFSFILHEKSSEEEALQELSLAKIEYPSVIEDFETGQKTIYAVVNEPCFPDQWAHIKSYTPLENPEIDWSQEWSSFSPYYKEGKAIIPLSDFYPSSQETLQLLPGPGFGDLSHQTTKLCLRLLAPFAKEKIIIDLGCGSGILSCAALKWESSFVYALDIDPEALVHAKKNAIANSVEEKIFLGISLPKSLEPEPSLLVMNMTFADQKKAISSLWAFPPVWITSGILLTQKDIYFSWMKELGFTCIDCKEEDQWIGCVFLQVEKSNNAF